MRIEIENNRTPVNEFFANLGTVPESVELTSHGKIVATVPPARATEEERSIAGNEGLELLKKARANAKKAHNLTERQLMSERQVELLSVTVVDEYRHSQRPLPKADRELWEFIDSARKQTRKLGLKDKEVERLVDRAVRETRKKNV